MEFTNTESMIWPDDLESEQLAFRPKYSQKEIESLISDKAILQLISTEAFKRLAEISFLGAIEYANRQDPLDRTRTTNSRYDHCVGVAVLANDYCMALGLSTHQRRTRVAAALLHDLGHPLLSHSAERIFKERLGLDHHSATEHLIRGRESFARDVPLILIEYGIDLDEVIELLDGKSDAIAFNPMAGPFNVDTLEGIFRCAIRFYSSFASAIPSPRLVLKASMNPERSENTPILDCFWRLKGTMYQDLVRSKAGVAADKIAQEYFGRKKHLSKNIFFSTDTNAQDDHALLFWALSTRTQKVRPTPFVNRDFQVNSNAPGTDFAVRYVETKSTATHEAALVNKRKHEGQSRGYISAIEGLPS